jgi:hypothetical protein
VKDEDLWAWAFGRAKQLKKNSVSDYIFSLIQEDKNKGFFTLPHHKTFEKNGNRPEVAH